MANGAKVGRDSSGKGDRLAEAARALSRALARLVFRPPVASVYNPLDYAWAAHRDYLEKYGTGPKRVVFLGMNPGPFGMVQTGVPFGEVAAVRDWLGVRGQIVPPPASHPKRPVHGFACTRSEVSGRRLWGLFQDRFVTPERFFADHFVLNYCPLAFAEESGRNLTPDKLPTREREPLFEACDRHLREVIDILQPTWVIGVGDFALERLGQVFSGTPLQLGKILHPSPASPAANRDWAGTATRQMIELGLWD